MQLNDWQKAVARTYSNGDYADFAGDGEVSEADLTRCGDTLFAFLMIELAETEDCDSSEEAVQRLERARVQFDDAIGALEALASAA